LTDNEWSELLEKTFPNNGNATNEILALALSERDVPGKIFDNDCRGYLRLASAFITFFIETLNTATETIKIKGWPSSADYTVAFNHFFILFRRFRACELLFESGYPLDGMAHLRDVKDRVILLCAVAKNRTSFAEIAGVVEGIKFDEIAAKLTRDLRQKASNRISKEFMGPSSGLDASDQAILEKWDGMFHLEVHNGLLSFTQEMMDLAKGIVPSIGPSRQTPSYYYFACRAAECGWMLNRLLPFIQPFKNALGPAWSEKNTILDRCFRHLVEHQGRSGNQAAASFIKMIDKKFTLTVESFYADSTYVKGK